MNHIEKANIVIGRLKGPSAVAKICECKPSSVCEWKINGLPRAREQFLRLAYPEAFAGLDDKPSQPDKKDQNHDHANSIA